MTLKCVFVVVPDVVVMILFLEKQIECSVSDGQIYTKSRLS